MGRFLLVAAALACSPAHADRADDIARLREEAAALRQSLDRLEAQIRALEGAPPEARAPAEPSLVAVHRSWSGIRPGISKERVSEALGAPGRVLRINGDLVWYYVYPGVGKGSVFFDREDKVTAVQAPNFGLF